MGLIVTLIVFGAAQFVYLKLKHSFLLPVFTATVVIIGLIFLTGTTYEAYYASARWIDWFLGPAVVALSLPLYKYRKMLFLNRKTIVSWVFFGAVIGIVSGAIVLWVFSIHESFVISALLKNTTTPVAIDIAAIYGGIPPLTAVICTMSGMLGAIVGPAVYRRFQVNSDIAKGVAMGAAGHAIGTARLMEDNDYAGAVSTISFLLMTVLMTVLTPVVVFLLY
ncbi:LrgB family protein [Evansella clarkii]|uniref:LrgB family protein n=1 Tax=Evansella clarkii TaxID=79879 RepID=UPI0009981663|nr:LrgB family protein [Evansella clarkii]